MLPRKSPCDPVQPGKTHLKAGGDAAQTLPPEGGRIFDMDGKTMGYWTLPDAALDDPDQAQD